MTRLIDRPEFWGGLLILIAAAGLALQARHWQRGRLTAGQAVTGMIARGGFLLLGIIYVAGLAETWRRAPFYGLAIVGLGIFLHLAVNVYHRIRGPEDET